MLTYLFAVGLAVMLVGLPYAIYIAVRPSTPPAERGVSVLVALASAFAAIARGINLSLLV